ncbi:MAG: peptide ABC transporter substrate-binding protein [Vicinamibacterales bacterium]
MTTSLRSRAAWLRVVPVVIAAAMLAACGGGGSGDGAAPSADTGGRKVLRLAYDREIDVLNAFTSQNLVDIQFSMVEGLVTTDDHNTYIPVLAKQIPTEENGLIVKNADGTVTMTWPLQEGVRWHDGEPFTSTDVCFTWKFVTSPASQVYNRHEYLGIIKCDTPDDNTVVFTWDGLYGYYDGLFEAVLPEHVLRGKTAEEIVNYTPYNRGTELVGTGPFKFAEWKAGEYIRVVRNDDYWRGKQYPAIDEIVWAFVPDNNTRFNAIKAGQYDWTKIIPTQVAEARGLEGYNVFLVSSNSLMHFDLSLNTDNAKALFSDPKVREAMFMAIDRQAIADQLLQGTVVLANSPINHTSPYSNPDVVASKYDAAEAARMLDAAGWKAGPDGVRVKDGRRFSFQLLNRAGTTERIAIAQVIQAQLKAVGIEVTFETLENAAWTQRWRSGQWETMVSAWFLPADPSVTGLYACDGSNNMTGFCDPSLDELMKQSDRYLDFEHRKEALDRVQALVAQAHRTLPLYFNVVPEVVSDRIVGHKGSGTNFGSFWNLWSWQLR